MSLDQEICRFLCDAILGLNECLILKGSFVNLVTLEDASWNKKETFLSSFIRTTNLSIKGIISSVLRHYLEKEATACGCFQVGCNAEKERI